MRMTRQQIRQETRESEGAPEQRSYQRQRMRAILNGGARAALKDATVVLVNPAHFAVALRYRPGLDHAPILVAKGRGATARALWEMATSRAIPVLSQPALARALYFTAKTGEPVHSELFVAVATVIAWVLNVRASMEADLSPVPVPPTMAFDADGLTTPA
jgi:flagellar biosynthetic protein FlhB